MSYIYDLVDTWNASGTTFTAVKMNVTDTASAAGSLLMDLQVGGSSRFKLGKLGDFSVNLVSGGIGLKFNDDIAGGRVTYITNGNSGAGGTFYIGGIGTLATAGLATSYSATYLRSGAFFGWASGSDINTSSDTILTRRAAANLRLGAADAAAPVAQTLSVQSGTAGASALSCSISGTTLTVGGAVTGTIAIGHAVTGTGVSAGTVITAGSGTTWTVNNSQTVSSTTMYFNSVGQNLTITGSQGSGPSAGGSIVFQVAPAGSAGTTSQNALVTFLEATSARAFNLYNTTDVTTNYERGKIAWSSNVLQIGTEKAGTGTGRGLALQADGVTRLEISSGGILGISGSTGWADTNQLFWQNRCVIASPSNGVLKISNRNENDFDRLQFGGTTSSFPALKRNSTALETKLADDSAYAPHAMQYLDVTDGITAPASATGRARIYVDTADGDLKVIFADGTVKTIVTDT